MATSELLAIAHVDISPRSSLELGEQLLGDLVARADETEGVIALAVLKQPTRTNHFEIVGRYESEGAYLEHLSSPANLAFRAGIAPMLGSPYEDRLHQPRAAESWPAVAIGDFVAVTQIEVRPEMVDEAKPFLDELAATQQRDAAVSGQAVVVRRGHANNIELVSAWRSVDAFDAHVDAESARGPRLSLGPLLVAPVDDRRHHVLWGNFGPG